MPNQTRGHKIESHFISYNHINRNYRVIVQSFRSSLLLTITDVTGVFMRQDNTLGMFIASTHVEISDVISR